MEWLKKIIVHYLVDIVDDERNNICKIDYEDIEYRADRMIEEIQRTLSARLDFKEEKK